MNDLTFTRRQALRTIIDRQEGYVAWQWQENRVRELAPFVSPPLEHQDRTVQALIDAGFVERDIRIRRMVRPTEKGRNAA